MTESDSRRVRGVLHKILEEPWPDFEQTMRCVLSDALEEAGDPRGLMCRYLQGWMHHDTLYYHAVKRESPYYLKVVLLKEFQDFGFLYNGDWVEVSWSTPEKGYRWDDNKVPVRLYDYSPDGKLNGPYWRPAKPWGKR